MCLSLKSCPIWRTVLFLYVPNCSLSLRAHCSLALRAQLWLSRMGLARRQHNKDPETGETQMGGMGELHLEVLVTRLTRQFNVSAKKVCACVCMCVHVCACTLAYTIAY